MQWSRAKKRFELLLAPSLQNRLNVYVTEYDTSSFDIGRGWITFDKTEIVSVMVPSFYSKNFCFRADTLDFGKAVAAYINMNIEEIKKSEDELINGFMFLDRRVGQKFIKSIKSNSLHPFARTLYLLRYQADRDKN